MLFRSHFDLYRLNDPYELELMGIRDYLDVPNALFLFEWPSKGGEEIPQADHVIDIQKTDDEMVREVTISSISAELITALQDLMLCSNQYSFNSPIGYSAFCISLGDVAL